MLTLRAAALLAACLVGNAVLVQADEVYYRWSLAELKLHRPDVPNQALPHHRSPSWASSFAPYVVLEGGGRAWLDYDQVEENIAFGDPVAKLATLKVLARLPQPGSVAGTLYLPRPDLSGMVKLPFTAAATAARQIEPRAFHAAVQQHYRRLLEREIAGAAWFRHRYRQAVRAQGLDPERVGDINTQPTWRRGRPDLYEMFSGGAAISENLQLDRELLLGSDVDEPPVPIGNIQGITVKAIDWTKHQADNPSAAPVQIDPLAKFVPHDQHLVLFPSFQAMLNVVDEVAEFGMPLASALEPRAEDTRLMQRYRDQLCLETTGWSRLLGGKLVTSVALTGSDPYLRTGSDMAVLFECGDELRATTLVGFIRAKQQAALERLGVEASRGDVAGLAYESVRSPDRGVCSYLARWGNVVVVANSPAQLARLQKVQQKQVESLGSLDEYRVFRERYVPGGDGESAFLFLSDNTIRRWCSPRWRIGNARRTKAAAVLAELDAQYLEQRLKGALPAEPVEFEFPVPELGRLTLTSSGVSSETYGLLSSQTPIIELELEQVSKAEAEAYERWRIGYESNWRQFFDPIGVRLAVSPEKLAIDLTVMPLIGGSELRRFREVVGGAKIAAEAGDRHAGTLWHAAIALDLDPQRPLVHLANGFLQSWTGVDQTLSCFGSSVAIYAEPDEIWKRLASANSNDRVRMMAIENKQFPIAVQFEVRDHALLDRVIEGLWKNAQQTEPDVKRFVRHHQGQPYVEVISPDFQEHDRLNYAQPPGRLILTLDKGVMHRALERFAAKEKDKRPAGGEKQPQTRPWLGQQMAFQASREFLELGEMFWGELTGGDSENTAQLRSWSNLPILNEWKALYPDRDPVELHQQLWHTRLTCPGGGEYVWNPRWQTMESTVYGSPASPRGSEQRLALPNLEFLNLGVTFEDEGLRGRAEMERKPRP